MPPPDEGKPVAVQYPVGRIGRRPPGQWLNDIKAEFGPLLGVERVYSRDQGSFKFLSGDPADTLYFPKGHHRSGESRYDWKDRGDGVMYGYLVPDDDDEEVPAPHAG